MQPPPASLCTPELRFAASEPDTYSETMSSQPVAAVRQKSRRGSRRRVARFLGTALVVLGLGAVTWTIVVWRWQDPFTALYTLYQQHKLASRYHKIEDAYHPLVAQRARKQHSSALQLAVERRLIALDARRYRRMLRPGQPLGRIKVPRLGLSSILVTGTDHDSLTKGPGWYTGSHLPGEGRLMYIAGHRTTYLAPFAHIDSLRPGDLVTIEVPYGRFVYRVTGHVIVPSDDVAQLRPGKREVVKLQACHPRFFATHRYIVYAVPVRVVPKGGKPYAVA
jgi:sortase A